MSHSAAAAEPGPGRTTDVLDFDEILTQIGEFGRYQRRNYLLICLPVLFAAANSLSYVFTAGTPTYRCYVPGCDSIESPDYHADWVHIAVPGTRSKKGTFKPATCERYVANETSTFSWEPLPEGQCTAANFTKEHERCLQFVYGSQERTIVQEWQLMCQENAWKLAFVGTTHFAGLVIGTAMFGYLADRFGRKRIFLFCILFMAVTGIAQALAWDYISFLSFALLNAVGTSGVYPLAFIIGVEMVGPRKREMSSIVLNYFYAVGEALLGLSVFLPNWRQLQLVLSIPPLIFLGYFWIVPESVRWLLARNQREKAGVIIRRAAEVNHRDISIELLASFKQQELDMESSCSDSKQKEKKEGSQIWLAVKEVFASHILIFRYVNMLFIWAVNAIVYYGLSLNSTSLSGNKYLNFTLVCLVEIPGYTLAWVCLRKLGRRLALSGSLLLCSVTCVASGYMTMRANWLIVSLFLIGKLGITSSFAVIYTYTAEMMPTVIRSGGVGVMSTFARCGAMLAPFVPLLGSYYEPLPMLLFGAASLMAGLLSLLLPETFHMKLPDTVEEAIALGK
ncbi:organic cation transporter protein [Drosophila guanche]|uniref:Blast:Organic cation transporter protein n=1 Tax=Drosophila guanche TaxID=7266 RepID=A0A3B0JPT2_DROGU|nr:organic cation transporter protein [Drosophila guanche]SPP75659.1 blast:Organic cation transporter protein [Drosophila guanche]